MNAADAMAALRITRPTLYNYTKNGTIKATKLPNGRYDYDDKFIYELINQKNNRKAIGYVCMPPYVFNRQRHDITLEMQALIRDTDYTIDDIYVDTSSDQIVTNRPKFTQLLLEVTLNKIHTIFVLDKNHIPSANSNWYEPILKRYNCGLIDLMETKK